MYKTIISALIVFSSLESALIKYLFYIKFIFINGPVKVVVTIRIVNIGNTSMQR